MNRRVVAMVFFTVFVLTHDARAQQLSAWLDASAARAQPPADVTGDPASYGLLGVRVRIDGTRASAVEIAAHGGRGAGDGRGSWASGSASGEMTRNFGMFALGARADVFALRYLHALRTDDGSSVKQSVAAVSARPHVGVSVGRTLLRAEADITRGGWRNETQASATGAVNTPIGGPLQKTPLLGDEVVSSGDITVAGGALSLLRTIDRATLQLTAEHYDATNQLPIDGGAYRGVGGTVMYGLGALDLAAGVRHWNAPRFGGRAENELGYHMALGAAVGQTMYARVTLARGVTDPMYGTPGSLGVSAGLSVRIGARRVDGAVPAVEVGGATRGGRKVVFRLRDARATRVAVAGDFNGWQPRAMRRAGEVWEAELELPAGVHHFSFVVDDERWTVPAGAPGIVDDGFGRKNATVVVQS